MVNIPYIQRQISVIATTELSNRLGVPVKIGGVDIEWFNRLVLEDLYLEDEDGNTLFEANHVTAGFETLPLLNGKFVFTTIRLFGFSLNLKKKTPDDPLNLQFVINAFASKDTTKNNPNIDLRFNSVMIRRGNFSYDVESINKTPGKFNVNHVDLKNISANISLKAFNQDSLNANIKKLSFDEASGFALDKLSLNIVGNHDSAFIDNFEIKLAQSNINIDKAIINLSEIDSFPTLLNAAPIELSIAPSQIYLKELSPFVPAFSNFTDNIELSAEATGYVNNINMKSLTLRYSDKMLFNGKMELKGITKPEETYIFGQVNRMFITTEGLSGMVNNFYEQKITLPDPVVKLGTIHFNGEISGFLDNLVAFGKISSSIGSIETDVIFGKNKIQDHVTSHIKGDIITNGLNIHELFEEGNPYGETRFDIHLDAVRSSDLDLTGKIEANIREFNYKGYKYENILLSGKILNNGFNGLLQIDDPNGELKVEGIIQQKGQNSIFNFTADLQHFRPDKLNLTDKYESPEIDFSLNADFTGNNIDNIEGSVLLNDFSFKTTPSNFNLKQLEIVASGHSADRKLTVSSDIINGEISGAYSFLTIIPSFMNTFKGYLPALINTTQKEQQFRHNNFSLLFTIENTDSLSTTLKLPFTMVSQGRITGHYNNQYDRFRLEVWLPQFKVGNSTFESGYLSCENPTDKINLQLRANNYNKNGLRNYLDLKVDAKDNLINTFVTWANNKEQAYKADLSASTLFVEEINDKNKNSLRTEVSINNSSLIVNDTIWNIEPAGITIQEGKINIDNFLVTHDKQYLHIDGLISKTPSDTLLLDLKQIELSYIFNILNIEVLQFGGEATGTFHINDLYGSRMLNTDLEVQNFSFNQVNLGRLNLFSEWDEAQKGILMLGSIYKNDTTWTDVNGYIYPVKPNDGLSLYFDANDIDISFLHPFLDNVAQNLKGRGFGNVHLYGPFNELTVEGKAFVQDGGLGIDFLDTYYTFSDSVYMDKTSISLKNATLYDKFGSSSRVSLTFNHKYFHDYDFRADIQANNMLLYDKSEKRSPMIYGTAFGTGTGSIYGNGKLINFDINMRSEPKTSINLNFMTSSASSEYDFITFVDKSKQEDSENLNTETFPLFRLNNTDEGAEYRMNIQVDITPEANIELVMDPTAGDRIRGNASGSLQIQYGSKSDLRMYGGMNIVNGNYNFSLQQIIHKDFKIREGSTIDFRGDPYSANLNINAIYNLTANLGDLDQGLLTESPRANIPVNCILNIDGMLRNPTISFDIELPGSNEELQRQVKSFIDTEDMMTRQIVYLLVLNKFYTPEYSTTEYRSNELSAVASSAISSQLSSILNSFTDKVQIGTNIRAAQDGFTDNTEVEMLLSSQLLDNRLLFNGNFGYKNSYMMEQKNVFIGEFDLEYKLTRNGDIRLKAYNHANDMYQYLKQSLTTQGVGIMFRKDFTHPSEIFRRRKRQPTLLTPTDTVPVIKPDTTVIRPQKQ